MPHSSSNEQAEANKVLTSEQEHNHEHSSNSTASVVQRSSSKDASCSDVEKQECIENQERDVDAKSDLAGGSQESERMDDSKGIDDSKESAERPDPIYYTGMGMGKYSANSLGRPIGPRQRRAEKCRGGKAS